MKKYIVVGLLLLIGIGLGVGVAAIYETKQTIKKEQAAMQAETAKVQAASAQKEQADALAKKDSTISVLRTQCQLGVSAYGQLTQTQKAKLQPPVCDAGSI